MADASSLLGEESAVAGGLRFDLSVLLNFNLYIIYMVIIDYS